MGVIAKQSSYAAIALGVGLVLGAANNMAVLPRAFEGKEEIWGLVRIMTSWGVICAALATLGAPGAIVRFLNRYSDKERDKALNSILAIALAGLTLTLGTILTFGEYWVTKLDPTHADLLTAHAPWFLAIMAIMSLLHIFRSLLTLALRTGYVSWIDEVWQKLSYVSLAVLLLFRRNSPPCFRSDVRGNLWGVAGAFRHPQYSDVQTCQRRVEPARHASVSGIQRF